MGIVLKFHWAVILLAPLLLAWSNQPVRVATWITFGLFALYTAGLQVHALLHPGRGFAPGVGYAVLAADLLLITSLISARGGLQSDTYHFYYLVIVGAGIVFGLRESLAAAAAAGILYGAAILVGGEGPADLGRVAIRMVYFAFTGIAAAYLTGREKRQRIGWAEAQRLLGELREAHAELTVHAHDMSQRAITDVLTQLYNHAYFHQRLDEELSRAQRHRRPLSLLMLDLDDFKAHNDRFGHVEGDKLLAAVGAVLTGAVRKGDTACRYGGEEFAVIMPEADLDAASAAAERMRRLVAEASLGRDREHDREPIPHPVTVSIGVATYPAHAVTKLELIEAADRALYRSKAAGKASIHTPPRP